MWFFSKKKNSIFKEDFVWMRRESMLLNMINDLKQLQGRDYTTFVSAFFPDTIKLIHQLLLKTEVVFNDYSNSGIIIIGKINLISAHKLMNLNISEYIAAEQSNHVVFMPEHHPLYSVEKEYISVLETSGNEINIRFYLSLQDPIFEIFGNHNIENMMLKLGMAEDEHITHSIISKSIENVQKKTEKRTAKIINTDSIEDWYKKNFNS